MQKIKDIEDSENFMYISATALKVGLFLLALLLSAGTALAPVAPGHNPTLVYTRNLVTIATWFFMAEFLMEWSTASKFFFDTYVNMKKFSIITVITAVLCVAKLVLALISIPAFMENGATLVVVYYISEIVAWVGLSIFFIAYSYRLITGRMK